MGGGKGSLVLYVLAIISLLCPHCQQLMPELNRIARQYPEVRVSACTVNPDNARWLPEFRKAFKVEVPLAICGKDIPTVRYVPYIVIKDRSGKVLVEGNGVNIEKEVKGRVRG